MNNWTKNTGKKFGWLKLGGNVGIQLGSILSSDSFVRVYWEGDPEDYDPLQVISSSLSVLRWGTKFILSLFSVSCLRSVVCPPFLSRREYVHVTSSVKSSVSLNEDWTPGLFRMVPNQIRNVMMNCRKQPSGSWVRKIVLDKRYKIIIVITLDRV